MRSPKRDRSRQLRLFLGGDDMTATDVLRCGDRAAFRGNMRAGRPDRVGDVASVIRCWVEKCRLHVWRSREYAINQICRVRHGSTRMRFAEKEDEFEVAANRATTDVFQTVMLGRMRPQGISDALDVPSVAGPRFSAIEDREDDVHPLAPRQIPIEHRAKRRDGDCRTGEKEEERRDGLRRHDHIHSEEARVVGQRIAAAPERCCRYSDVPVGRWRREKYWHHPAWPQRVSTKSSAFMAIALNLD